MCDLGDSSVLGLCEIGTVSNVCVFSVYLVCQKIAKREKHLEPGCFGKV